MHRLGALLFARGAQKTLGSVAVLPTPSGDGLKKMLTGAAALLKVVGGAVHGP